VDWAVSEQVREVEEDNRWIWFSEPVANVDDEKVRSVCEVKRVRVFFLGGRWSDPSLVWFLCLIIWFFMSINC